jgi:cell fate (sporulation/competence/biofilm development) regulator YmcA (YheA/YmcA/DUF963 family)
MKTRKTKTFEKEFSKAFKELSAYAEEVQAYVDACKTVRKFEKKHKDRTKLINYYRQTYLDRKG